MMRSLLAVFLFLPACTVGPLICTSGDPCSNPGSNDNAPLIATGVVALVVLTALVASHHNDDAPIRQPPPQIVFITAPAPTGFGNPVGDDESLRLPRMVFQAQVLARGGHCEGVIALAHNIQRASPSYYQQAFVTDPPIAACLQSRAPDPRRSSVDPE